MTRFREEVYGARWYKALVKAQASELLKGAPPREVRWGSLRYINNGKSRSRDTSSDSPAKRRLNGF